MRPFAFRLRNTVPNQNGTRHRTPPFIAAKLCSPHGHETLHGCGVVWLSAYIMCEKSIHTQREICAAVLDLVCGEMGWGGHYGSEGVVAVIPLQPSKHACLYFEAPCAVMTLLDGQSLCGQ